MQPKEINCQSVLFRCPRKMREALVAQAGGRRKISEFVRKAVAAQLALAGENANRRSNGSAPPLSYG